jgi:hypothetical protein
MVSPFITVCSRRHRNPRFRFSTPSIALVWAERQLNFSVALNNNLLYFFEAAGDVKIERGCLLSPTCGFHLSFCTAVMFRALISHTYIVTSPRQVVEIILAHPQELAPFFFSP